MTRSPARQYAVLAFLLLWALVAQLTYSGYLVYLQTSASRFAAIPFLTGNLSTVIDEIPPTYAGSLLRRGDKVVAVNGNTVRGQEQLDHLRSSSQPGDTLRVTVERTAGEKSERLTIPVRLQPSSPQWLKVLAFSLFLPLSCLVVGFYIALARPRDPVAWITLAMLASLGQIVDSVSWALPSPWREIHFIYHALLAYSWPLWLLLFALYFPVPFPGAKKLKWLNWLLAVPFACVASLELYGYLKAGAHLQEVRWLDNFLHRANNTVNILFTIFVFAFFILLGFKKGIIREPDARRRINVMTVGCSAALTPLLPVVFLDPPVWLDTLCLLMVIFFPITMAYVIVVQRAMDVRMVVRSGVRYALATNGIKVLRAVLVAVLIVVTVELEQQSSHRWEGILIAAIGVSLVISVGKLARIVTSWMDRRFFREAYNAELILTDLGNSVAGIRDVKTLLQTVTQRISDSLHVERIAVLLERGQAYEPAYALGYGSAIPETGLARDTATVRMLRRSRAPSRIYFDDPQSWVHGTPEAEQSFLQNLRSQILLPVTLNNRMLGVISLGAKKSQAPYSQGDLQLLGAVASQAGLALENAELTETIRREVASRERLDRELEIAREVQQRLFPQTLPEVIGLDFAGYCRPALGVGGDYYDFIRVPDGCLGIAVGDVSGKGIAAALMMASLQASLRGQTIKPCETLSEMIQHINRLVYEASANNRYATFFYAQYEPVSRALRYVNAGHNPPIVYRKSDGAHQVYRLDEGGTVLGLFPDFEFREARMALQPGDVLVAFTDGVSEAMNLAEEEFDEERLIQALKQQQARTAADTITGILERVDAFTTGARQHDDMTLVVVRVQ